MLPFPTDLSTLSDAVKTDVVKQIAYDKLAKKVNAIDTSELVEKQIITPRSKILKLKNLVLLT